ncbi:Os04g0513550 [Oryza sativa Japonica Group]|uniref:Os04g0513550 protein n=1 Tax=Oryza sativa subsp. japonica TaxID=39947 RepID=A0A0P0WCD6_ORYSJ|nr:hypothetical protein EE612_024383 [Oryza sativa]BAS90061.1 Os04g0513550 [Oryza sativa Japonica Group]
MHKTKQMLQKVITEEETSSSYGFANYFAVSSTNGVYESIPLVSVKRARRIDAILCVNCCVMIYPNEINLVILQ